MTNLLIHSLSEFSEIINGVLEIASPKHIVEVGAESGRTTEVLIEWAMTHGSTITTIDPAPAEKVRALAGRYPDILQLALARTPDALDDVSAGDLYLIDGDHNYWVVSGELAKVHARVKEANVHPVLLMHDVGWPCARRDHYYDPKQLPPEAVHPHTFELGLHIDKPDPIEGGFSSAGFYAIALKEGGPRNGVLTAVEEFIAANPDWELHVIPAVFGLGVLFPSAHPQHAKLRELVRPYARNPMIARLEQNRMRNWLETRRLQVVEETLMRSREGVYAERDVLLSERDFARLERDAARQERDAARQESEARSARIAELEQKLQEAEARAAATDTKLAEKTARLEEVESRWYAKAGRFVTRKND